MRGEKFNYSKTGAVFTGSSPHARGKVKTLDITI